MEISCATQGATIHYTTDCSTPTTESCSVPMVVV
ncbi:MAG: chitobiase/beta-hexosaminidase C-terminal domain-containing protein [Prevotella sp.]|nr:chitobiase/beta-hexosaminidase C-terminal domain-containing protein [Prevotella sp.]